MRQKDYPAAGNYLRKACEAEIKRILPKNLKLKTDYNSGEIKRIEKLETFIDNFFTYLAKNNLDSLPFINLKTYKKIVFNSMSHDDLEAPHYRREIQDGILVIENLQKIKTKEIVEAKDSETKPLKLGMRDEITATMHHYEINVTENLHIIQQDMAQIKLSQTECEVTEGGVTRKFPSLQASFNQLWSERSYAMPINNTIFYNNISVSNKKKLIDLMSF